MSLVPPTIEAYQVQHLPIVKAYADKIGLVEVINQVVPTEMAVDPGTIVLGMILDTLSGRSPLYRLEEFFAQPAILGEWLVILMNVSSPIAFRFRRYVWRQQQALSQRFSILRPPLFPRTYLLRAGCG
jgi:hypothetical protein